MRVARQRVGQLPQRLPGVALLAHEVMHPALGENLLEGVLLQIDAVQRVEHVAQRADDGGVQLLLRELRSLLLPGGLP